MLHRSWLIQKEFSGNFRVIFGLIMLCLGLFSSSSFFFINLHVFCLYMVISDCVFMQFLVLPMCVPLHLKGFLVVFLRQFVFLSVRVSA